MALTPSTCCCPSSDIPCCGRDICPTTGTGTGDCLPRILYASFENISSGCDCVCGESSGTGSGSGSGSGTTTCPIISLYWYEEIIPAGGKASHWKGSLDVGCLGVVTIDIECAGESIVASPDWNLLYNDDCSQREPPGPTTSSCDPLDLFFGSVGGANTCCEDPATADFDIRITE